MRFRSKRRTDWNTYSFGEGMTTLKLISINDDPITLQTKKNVSNFEKFSIQIWIKLCSEEETSGIIWDVGAFIGIYGLIAAKASAENRVYCFEPSSAPFYRLLSHIQLNEMWSRVFPLKIALSDRAESLQLHHPFGWYVLGSGDNLSNLYSTSFFQENVALEIADCLVFDNHFYEMDFTNQVPQIGAPALIKVDIEGHEVNFIKGSIRTIAESKPIFLIEILTEDQFNLVSAELEEYKWVAINESENRFSVSPNFDIEGSNNFLFCHRDKVVQVSESLRTLGVINWN